MTDDIPPNMSSTQRAAFYQANRVEQLREEVKAVEARVNAGFGAEVLPVFRVTTADWLDVLRADLLEAEGERAILVAGCRAAVAGA